jgi:hypothetical protein
MKWPLCISILALWLSVFYLSPSYGGCSGGSCSPVGGVGFPVQAPVQYAPAPVFNWYEWREVDGKQIALYQNGIQIGNYSLEGSYYREYSYTRRAWEAPGQPPIPPPVDLLSKYARENKPPQEKKPAVQSPKKCSCYPCDEGCADGCPCKDRDKYPCSRDECTCKQQKVGEIPTGVVTEKIEHGVTSISGKKCGCGDAFDALTGTLPDDSGKCYLTVIDADDTRRASVLKAILSVPESKNFLVQDINPNTPMENWMLDCGFKKPEASGTVVYAQAPNGKVIWRADDADKGMDRVKVAIRKTDPNYDPRKDPDLNPHAAPTPMPAPAPGPVVPEPEPFKPGTIHYCCAGLAVFVLYLLYQKKEK